MGSHVCSDFSFRDPKPSKLLHQIGYVVGVGVAVVRTSLLGLQVDVVPGDTVGPACGEDEKDDEDENEGEDDEDEDD